MFKNNYAISNMLSNNNYNYHRAKNNNIIGFKCFQIPRGFEET